MKIVVRTVALLTLSAAILLLRSYSNSQEAGAQDGGSQSSGQSSGQDSGAQYPVVGIQKGVWNGGQAALWDLHVLDHFRYFGPKERLRGFRPEQPIKFSHVTHVQKNKIECQYCHWSVTKSPYAAIPEIETCAGCHQSIQIPGAEPVASGVTGTTQEQKDEIKKIHQHKAEGKPIEWVKVHVTPDYVKFNHKRHVKAGVACQECHGQVPEMEVVERVSSMKMGWCVSCHRAQGTSIDCYACHR